MSKLEITTNSKGVTSIRDTKTGQSEIVHLSGNIPSKTVNITAESSGMAAHLLFRTDAPEKS